MNACFCLSLSVFPHMLCDFSSVSFVFFFFCVSFFTHTTLQMSGRGHKQSGFSLWWFVVSSVYDFGEVQSALFLFCIKMRATLLIDVTVMCF